MAMIRARHRHRGPRNTGQPREIRIRLQCRTKCRSRRRDQGGVIGARPLVLGIRELAVSRALRERRCDRMRTKCALEAIRRRGTLADVSAGMCQRAIVDSGHIRRIDRAHRPRGTTVAKIARTVERTHRSRSSAVVDRAMRTGSAAIATTRDLC